MLINERTAKQWFAEAEAWYAERHQACPWCRRANCLYRKKGDSILEYECGRCDFFTCRSVYAGNYFVDAGRKCQGVRTMAHQAS
jgi:hypothetical protein